MAGGLMQLSAYGTENQYLNGNPQITYFKVVYKRYTNFAIETINIQLNGQQNAATELSWDNYTVLKTKIPRNADLLSGLYITFDLPDIYSSADDAFQWVRNIGAVMINYVRIYIGGYKIEELTGEQMYLWARLSQTDEKLKSYREMIGNLPELYDPALANSGEYPGYNPNPTEFGLITSKFYNCAPSIRGRKLYVPLPFWFCKYHGCALPLIALQYHDVDFEISLRPIRQLYTIRTQEVGVALQVQYEKTTVPAYYDYSSTFPGPDINLKIGEFPSFYRIAPTDDYFITNYTNPTSTSKQIWNLNPQLFGNYVYIDDQERKVFAEIAHQYLFDQHYVIQSRDFYGEHKVELEIYHPGKEIYFPLRRNDVYRTNQWTNYTIYDYEGQDVKSYNNYWWQISNYIINTGGFTAYFRGPGNTFSAPIVNLPTNPLSLFAVLFGPFGIAQINDLVSPTPPPFGVRFSNGATPLVGTTLDVVIPIQQLYTLADIQAFRAIWEYRPLATGNIPVITTANSPYWTPNIILEAFIEFEGNIREDTKDYKYWNELQPYLYHINSGIPGLNIYSFSLNPDEYQPKGSCNFSQMRNVFIHVKTKQPEEVNGSLYFQFEMTSFVNYYNILQIQAGMGGIMFAN